MGGAFVSVMRTPKVELLSGRGECSSDTSRSCVTRGATVVDSDARGQVVNSLDDVRAAMRNQAAAVVISTVLATVQAFSIPAW